MATTPRDQDELSSQGASSAGAPDDAPAPPAGPHGQGSVHSMGGSAGEEVAVANQRTNWPPNPEQFVSPPSSAAGHRPPTLARDPTAPVYVPGDPNSLVPGEVDQQGREPNPTPTALPDDGDEHYRVRPEPALDDIPRDARHARAQEAAAQEAAALAAQESAVTRDSSAGKGELTSSSGATARERSLHERGKGTASGGQQGAGSGAKAYRPAAPKPPTPPSAA